MPTKLAMELHHPHKTANCKNSKLPAGLTCLNPCCFFCAMNEPDLSLRRTRITKCFAQMPLTDDQEHVLALSGLWNLAMAQPDDPEFPSLGIFECMASLIRRAINDRDWLLRDQNIYIPYYAAHIIGSYAMNESHFAEKAVKSGVISPLMELLRGKISWVEQRVAVRALGHLGGHEKTFEAISVHEVEIVDLTMEIASTCLDTIYASFVRVKEKKRLKYHCNLLTKGVGGLEFQNRKAEEWASQLQCWSLFLLNCFACGERSLNLICKQEFLRDLCGMWGGLANRTSPAGIGLIGSLCYTKIGRKSIADSKEVVRNLCIVSRSSDKWQYMAIDSLLFILKDPDTRYKVLDIAVPYLVDLAELRSTGGRKKVGEAITQTLLLDYYKIKYGDLNLKNARAEKALEEIWDLKVERRKREMIMSEQEIRERKVLAGLMKQQGNHNFRLGNIKEAVIRYSKALDLCPLNMGKERIVLHSNRAQCYLLLGDPESAISDATRALCLSMNSHSKSLWRRSQAYDMKGSAKESLMDCLTFINGRTKSERTRNVRIPYYASRMITKQMNATWLFGVAESKARKNKEEVRDSDGQDQVGDRTMMLVGRENKKGFPGMPAIAEEPLIKMRGGRRKVERSERTKKGVFVSFLG